jgi:2-amino-4-hydroxy-6-hydroxymethyldihydropteridine diphosphokinase
VGERKTAFVGLGSNLGDRAGNLGRALALLREKGAPATRTSSLYLTEPVGGPPQDWFCNAVAALETDLAPEALLAACLRTEEEMGRVRTVKDGPRTIDLDLLLRGDERREGPGLVLPHPRLHLRRFVLVPLAEIAPDAVHPGLGATVRELLLRCPDPSEVRPFVKALA